MFIVGCPLCQRQFECPPEWGGKLVQCPACGNRFVAGAPTGPMLPSIPVLSEASGYNAKPRSEPPPIPVMPPAMPVLSPAPPPVSLPPPHVPQARRAGLRAVLATLFVVCGLIVASIVYRTRERPPQVDDDLDRARRLAMRQAIKNQDAERDIRPEDEEAANDAKRSVHEIIDACTRRDTARLLNHCDFDRMLHLMRSYGLAERALAAFNATDQLRTGFRQLTTIPHSVWGAPRYELRSMKRLGNSDFVVYLQGHLADGPIPLRWWLCQDNHRWRFYDWESTSRGMRGALVMAIAIDATADRAFAVQRSLQALNETFEALETLNVDAARGKSARVDAPSLHPHLRACHLFARGMIAHLDQNFDEAMELYDEAAKLNPDMPILMLWRGDCHGALNQHEQAVRLLTRFRDQFGDNAFLCSSLGGAYQNLRRFPEAAAEYRKSLDINPRDGEAFIGLARSLDPLAPRDDLAPRFAKLDNRANCYGPVADHFVANLDAVALEPLSREMLKIDRTHPDALFHLSLVKLWQGKGAEGIEQFLGVLKLWPRHPNRAARVEHFCRELVLSNLAEHAYPSLADVPEAFPILSAELLKNHQPDVLRHVVRGHAKTSPNDPRLKVFQAVLLVNDRKYAEAHKLFEQAAKERGNDNALHDARPERVLACFHTGRALDALEHIPPRAETFQQLVNLCGIKSDHKLLGALLDAYAKKEPGALVVLQTRVRLKILEKKYDEAVAHFKDAWNQHSAQWIESERKSFIEGFLMNMVDAKKALEAYQAAPDAKEAFQFLCRDMNLIAQRDALRALGAAHRKAHPGDPQGFWLSGRLHAADKTWDKAIEDLDKARRLLPAPDADTAKLDLLDARYQAGQLIEAYQEVGPSEPVFLQLAANCLRDKKWDDLEKLIAAHRPVAQVDSQLLLYEARLLVGRKRYDDAIRTFKQWGDRQTPPGGGDFLLGGFVQDLLDAGVGFDAYRRLPYKDRVFVELARTWTMRKNAKRLATLVEEHAQTNANDVRLAFYRGELHFLKGEYAEAERQFAVARAKAPANASYAEKQRLLSARVKLGKTVEAYRELGPGIIAFESVCQTCINEKEPDQLAAVLAEQRRLDADEAGLLAWEAELLWLKNDYEGIVKLLKAPATPPTSRQRWRCDDKLVRALVKLKRHDEAILEAERLNVDSGAVPMWLVLAHASKGDVAKCIALLEKYPGDAYLTTMSYADPDLGPIFGSGAFKPLRDKFPEPPPVPTPPVDMD